MDTLLRFSLDYRPFLAGVFWIVFGSIVLFPTVVVAQPSGGAQALPTAADGAEAVTTTDMDGDRDQDVLVASRGDDTIGWIENPGAGSFGGQTVISDSADGTSDVRAADLDGDSALEVVTAASGDGEVNLYDNDGSATFPFGGESYGSTHARTPTGRF